MSIPPLLPAHFFRLFLETLDAELGPKTLTMVLEKANLDPVLIDPRAVSHLTGDAPARPAPGQAETYARIQHALRVYYGRGARGTLVRIGRILWGRLLDTASLPEKAQAQLAHSLPAGQRLKAVLELLARFMREQNADVSVHTLDIELLLADHVGAATIGQKENAPVCFVTLGLIQEALVWVSGHEYDVEEVSCRAAGGDACEFKIAVSGNKVTVNEWKWTSRDGLEMYARGWIPAQQPKAVVCLAHGLGEHVNRYNHVGQAFAAAGYVLQGFDLRGHGRSGGPRGHTPSYESLLDDISDFLADARKRHPGLPVFLYGHSMGGNQAINYALRYPDGLRGVIVTGPWLKLAFEPTAAQLTLAKMMNVIFPSFAQSNGLEQAALSRDAEIVRAYAADPLVHDRISARLFTVTYANGLMALEHASALKVPTLLMHGNADRVCSVDGSKEFAQKAGSIVTLRIWDGLYHETHNEPEKADVIRAMIDWISAHL